MELGRGGVRDGERRGGMGTGKGGEGRGEDDGSER